MLDLRGVATWVVCFCVDAILLILLVRVVPPVLVWLLAQISSFARWVAKIVRGHRTLLWFLLVSRFWAFMLLPSPVLNTWSVRTLHRKIAMRAEQMGDWIYIMSPDRRDWGMGHRIKQWTVKPVFVDIYNRSTQCMLQKEELRIRVHVPLAETVLLSHGLCHGQSYRSATWGGMLDPSEGISVRGQAQREAELENLCTGWVEHSACLNKRPIVHITGVCLQPVAALVEVVDEDTRDFVVDLQINATNLHMYLLLLGEDVTLPTISIKSDCT